MADTKQATPKRRKHDAIFDIAQRLQTENEELKRQLASRSGPDRTTQEPREWLIAKRGAAGQWINKNTDAPIMWTHDEVLAYLAEAGSDRTTQELAAWKALGFDTPNAIEVVIRAASEMAKSREDKLRKAEQCISELREDDHEKAMMKVLTERDEAQEWADNLAYAVGEYFDIDVGEHSSCSDPRVEAVKILKGEYVTKFDKPAQEEAPRSHDWIHEDELPADYPYHAMFPYSIIPGGVGCRVFPRLPERGAGPREAKIAS